MRRDCAVACGLTAGKSDALNRIFLFIILGYPADRKGKALRQADGYSIKETTSSVFEDMMNNGMSHA